MADVSATFANPLAAADAVRVGLLPRDYEVGETVTLDEQNAELLRLLGIMTPEGSPGGSTLDPFLVLVAASLGLHNVADVVTTAGGVVLGEHNPVDATAAAVAMTIANAPTPGQLTSIEKTDSSAHTVTLTGKIRGVTGTTLTLAWQYQSFLLVSKSDGSWWPVGGHIAKASLDAAYAPSSAATASWANMPAGATGSVIYNSVTSAYPARPSARTDVYFAWVGPVEPPSGSGGTLPGDWWVDVTAV